MKLGTNDISSVYLGTNAVQSVYLGTNEVWSAFNSGLLDTYGGAAAAYSLRRLSSSYTGKAIRVRRASDNTEQDIGFVGENLDTSALTSFCSGTNGFVKTWYDQSGNGYDAAQSTAAKQPQIVSSGSVILDNGKPTIQFIRASDTTLQGAFSTTYSQPNTIFITLSPNNLGIDNRFFDGDDNTNRQAIAFSSSNQYQIFAGASLIGGSVTLGRRIITALFNTTSSLIRNNGTQQMSGNAGETSIDGVSIGSDRSGIINNFDGKIQEVIFYPSNQTSNFSGIESNINSFYSIY